MKRILTTVVAAAAVATLLVVIGSQAASSTGVHRSSTRSTHRRLLSRFSVLRSARTASSSTSSIPASKVNGLTKAGTLVTELELEPESAAPIEVGGEEAWVIPGRAGMCLAVSGAIVVNEVCGSLANAEAGRLVMVRLPRAGRVIVSGVVPNGASVTVAGTNGSTAHVPVTGNVFNYEGASLRSVSVSQIGRPATEVNIEAPIG
jgi:hypothetical protein